MGGDFQVMEARGTWGLFQERFGAAPREKSSDLKGFRGVPLATITNASHTEVRALWQQLMMRCAQ